MLKKSILLLMLIFATGFASPSSAVQTQKIYGVMDDGPYACIASDAGFGYLKKTVWVTPGNWHLSDLNQSYMQRFDADMQQASTCGMNVILQIWPVPQFGMPLRSSQRSGVCDVAKDLADKYPQVQYFEIGLEPNSHYFGGRQFVNGVNVSAAAYVSWLATCYTKLKKVNPNLMVIGGSLASRGQDNPSSQKSDTSPVAFIQKMCETYKSLGRSTPLMDIFDMHSYPDPGNQDPQTQHPLPSTTITIADYDKLESLLSCFSGTAQPLPPILWGESGYNTVVPDPQKDRYQGRKPASVQQVDEPTQGRYIKEEIGMSTCQENSLGLINLHVVDDSSLKNGWQSGIVYAPNHQERRESEASANYTHKQSWPIVRRALDAAASGSINCGSPGSP